MLNPGKALFKLQLQFKVATFLTSEAYIGKQFDQHKTTTIDSICSIHPNGVIDIDRGRNNTDEN